MKTNIDRTLVVKNIIAKYTNMTQYMKYLCAVLLIIGTSAHAWAVTETMDFTQCWGIGTSYESGVYTYGGYAIQAHDAKYNEYNDYWILNYYRENTPSRPAWGGIILPPFNGTVSSITVTTGSGSGSDLRTIQLYVNGTLQATSTSLAASSSYTFTSLSIAAGSTIELRNNTNNNEFHLASLSITHNGSQMGTAAVSGKSVVSASADGNGTVTVSSNPVSYDATTTLTAVPASGWQFDYWEVTSVGNTCTNYAPYSTRWTQNEFTADNIIGLSTDASIELYNFTYPDYFIAVAHFVETTCTIDTKVVFANSGTQNVNASTSAQTFDNAGTAKRVSNNANTGQTVTYTSSNPSVTVNASGRVSIPANFIGSVTITATAAENGDYCESSESYTLNVNGYNVTYHVKSCVSGKPANKTNYLGSLTLPTGLSIDGYQFAGWTTNGSYSDNSTPPTLQPASITVTADVDLYAVFKKVSSTFEKMPENTSGSVNTSIPEGDYVICTNYDVGSTARVMTNTLDGNKRMTTDATEYTFTAAGLSCTDEEYIWHISGTAGNYLIYNANSNKYLAATSGATESSDRKVRLVDSSSDTYAKWTIEQNSGKVPYMFTNTKRKTDSESEKSLGVSSNNIFFRGDSYKATFYLFKRVSAGSVYTLDPDCDATEYTVTFNMASVPTGCSVTSSATGATFSSPVLSPVTSGTSVTIGATAGTGYHFDHWTVTSGGASLSSSASTASNGFTMPASNVVLTPVYAADSYTINYLDKGGSAFSGTHDTGYPTTHTYGTETTLSGATKSGWEFAGWYTTSTCTSGTQVTSLGATDYTSSPTLYALWVHFTDPLAWCPEPEVVLTGTTYITSLYHADNGGMVRGSQQLTLTGRNMGIDEDVTLTSNNPNVYFSTSTYENIKRGAANQPKTSLTLKTDANGKLNGDEGYTIYVHFMPSAAGDGSISDVTVTATYAVPEPDEVSTTHVYVRSMPTQFAVATKVGNTWYALPANMSGAGNPVPVQIEVNETNWTAKGPATVSHAMWPVHTTSAATPSYTANGDHWRLTGNSNKALWASTAAGGYTINNNAAVTAVGDNVTTAYEWQITTTPADLENPTSGTWKYYIQSHQANNTRYLNIKSNDIIWGTYTDSYQLTKDMYLLPLTAVETANMNVMEWGESEIALQCAANTTLTKVTINGTEVSPKPSLTSLGGDIYKITGGGMPNLSTLATYAMKSMVIDVSESGTPKQLILTIPFILTSANSPAAEPKTAVNLRNLAEGGSQAARNTIIGVVDVVVRNGAQLDVTNAEATYCTFKDLYIYPGGKVHINTLDLGAKNVYLRGGFSWLEAKKDYRLPQMLVESGKKIEGVGTAGNGIYYDLHLDGSRYYMIAVPKDVPLGSITNEEGVANFTAWVKQYDGEGRTLSPKRNGWVSTITGNTLYRGVGYEMAIKPRVAGRTIGVLRMPLLKAAAWTDETECTPSVTAWGVDNPNVSANNRGWNFIGAPFFTSFRSTDENGQLGANMEIRDMVHHEDANGNWTGTWDWTTTSDVKYVTIPQKMYDDYSDVRAKNYVLEAFYPFFIQAATPGNLSFTAGSKVLKAPSLLRTAVREREVDIDFMLSDGNGVSDQAGLTVGNEYSADFDMDDKEKTIVNENYLKVYTMVGEYRTAFNSLPEGVAELPIPVGYIAPKAGYYFFSMVEGNYSEVEHVWLTDYETSSTVDLLDGIYEFQCEKGTNNNRFVLNIVLKAEHDNTATGLDEVEGDSQQPLKFIYQDKMYIRHGGVLYDATGKQVREIK